MLYNLWFSIARQAFEPLQQDYEKIWEVMDYLADSFYFLDIFVQFRTGYLEQGKCILTLRGHGERRNANYIQSMPNRIVEHCAASTGSSLVRLFSSTILELIISLRSCRRGTPSDRF